MDAISNLLRLADAYCAVTRLAEATVSTRCFADGKRLARIRAGGDIGSRRLSAAFEWFAAHWPEDATWPADISRPVVTPSERAA